ncbi:MAG: stage V sporulation protein AE [Oscillospiraceae bacterium]|nr:stage V sporulation protein AE [Oscillospiraceae bacterium]
MQIILELLKAFFVGGVICAVGQLFIDYTKLTPARILTSYVIAGVILSAVGIYQPLVEFAGAGATVPLTGFGHLLAQGVRDAIAEKGALGILSGGMGAAAGGITAALLAGLLASLCFKKRMKT